ncbi:MAG TPA: amine oxidase, partial [Desulfomonilaceae bacterium]|nr:amine oxidase [Desulfomonilaceae bacterium]
MDNQRVRERENQCIQEQPPWCTAACPIHVDARGMIECIRKQDFTAAFAIFNRFVPLPRIISRICDHPCEPECKRNEVGGAIQINALERACVE